MPGQHQISAQVPYGVALGTGKTIVVSNGANPSANSTIDIAATAPGIFTLDGSGGGQAAAINTSAATGAVTINPSGNAAKVADAISLYLTGEGVYTNTPTPVDGYVIPVGTLLPAMPILTTAVTVTIGGVAAAVTYAGAFDERDARRAPDQCHDSSTHNRSRHSGRGQHWRNQRRPVQRSRPSHRLAVTAFHTLPPAVTAKQLTRIRRDKFDSRHRDPVRLLIY